MWYCATWLTKWMIHCSFICTVVKSTRVTCIYDPEFNNILFKRVIACCSKLHRVAVCCSVLQRVAVWCIVSQCVVVCCSVLCCVWMQCVSICFSVLHFVSICFSVLQCIPTHLKTSTLHQIIHSSRHTLRNLRFGAQIHPLLSWSPFRSANKINDRFWAQFAGNFVERFC